MLLSPLSSFCARALDVTSAAFLLSLPELPELSDPRTTRDDIYLDACLTLNAMRDNGEIDDVFFDYLCMHLDYAFAQGGTHA